LDFAASADFVARRCRKLCVDHQKQTRVTGSAASKEFRFDRFVIEPATRRILIDGRPGAVGARAFDLLLALVERRERMVSKNELLDLVWPGLVVEENNLQVHISALRKLLGPAVIATIPGRGYRFTARIDNAAEEVAEAVPARPVSAAAPGNLPGQRPSIFGRDEDLRALIGLIEAHPLVTVVGAPGIGKTTLARAAAHVLRDRWSDGAWMVELAKIANPAQFPESVAQALHITLSGPGTVQDQLVSVLKSQRLLLVLDNCEHMVEASGALAEAIAAHAPGVRLLTTSLELLNVPHEQLFKLGPLAVPAADEPANHEEFGAVRLFVERAQAADPRFTLSATTAAAVAEICRRLDGLPLAIELAAARVRLLGVHGVRDRLGERFRLLTGGARTGLRRHQTLQAAIDWSHRLLSAEEQAVLRRLGVFVGGFTLELAQEVAGDEHIDEWAVLDALGALVDKSLVAADADEPPRYRLLETTRAYELEKLADAGETADLMERHARAVCSLFVQTEEARFGERGTLSMHDFVQRLEPELDNVRAALGWAMGDAGDVATAVALAVASAAVFRLLGLTQEALRFMQRLTGGVDARVNPEQAALFWSSLSDLGGSGRLPKAAAMEAATRAEEMFRQRGSWRRLYYSLYSKAWTLSLIGEHAAAEAILPDLDALLDPNWPSWVRALSLNLRGYICLQQERFEDAAALHTEQRTLLEREPGEEERLFSGLVNLCDALVGVRRYEEAVALAQLVIERTGGRRFGEVGYAMARLTASLTFLGRLDEADHSMRQAMAGWRRDGMLLYVSGYLAMLLAEQGRFTDAARVDGAAIAFIERSGHAHPLLKRARARLLELFEAAAVTSDDIERWQREGASLDEASLAAICVGSGP
jgi:predicted ATPase/DNA-binding winged helix-turn-helix (wHTH) protein